MTVKNFLKRFPEFENTDPKLVEMVLAESQNEMNRKYRGEQHFSKKPKWTISYEHR